MNESSVPKLTIITVCNEANKDKGNKLLQAEYKKLSFLNPKINLIHGIESADAYNEFCIRQLYKHFDTEYCLIVQFDGYIIDPSKWNPSFLKYDYIGAPWKSFSPLQKRISSNLTKDNLVGNGGFSLRSKRLCEELAKCSDKDFPIDGKSYIEDAYICQVKREYLEKEKDFKFAPYEIAKEFSVECGDYSCQFGGHNYIIKDGHKISLKI